MIRLVTSSIPARTNHVAPEAEARAAAAAATDSDPQETREWLEAFERVLQTDRERGLYLLRRLEDYGKERGLVPVAPPFSAYRNTIALEQQGTYPGDLVLEQRL